MLRRSCIRSKSLISLEQCSTISYIDYRYIKRFLYKLFIEVVVFISLEQYSTRGCRVAGLSASSLIIREKKEERKISKIYMPASTSTGLKYLFALLLTANVLLPRELDCYNYYVKEASKPTLRVAN
ncbi:hypothetical protein HBI08_239030 [Parastagonospora nodorum]|nr:hypothetical protein HBI08_239030 [Parastagonospora nodorum]